MPPFNYFAYDNILHSFCPVEHLQIALSITEGKPPCLHPQLSVASIFEYRRREACSVAQFVRIARLITAMSKLASHLQPEVFKTSAANLASSDHRRHPPPP